MPVERVKDVLIPTQMRALDRDPRGYPIPWGVFRDATGKPHFTINEETRRLLALFEDRCPICGGKLAKKRWFVGGPLSAFDDHGAYLDPPMHSACAHYSLKVCPSLATPNYRKRIDTGTLKKSDVEDTRIFMDPTQIPERPEYFIAVLTDGQTITPNYYIRPKRPYLKAEQWCQGVLLASSV